VGPVTGTAARLLAVIRLATAATAVGLLAGHRVTPHDGLLVAGTIAYTGMALAAQRWAPALAARPGAAVLDTGVALTLVVLSGDWRSPFYLLAVATLAGPAARRPVPRAVALGLAFGATYAVVGHFVGPDPLRLGAQTTADTLATHLVLPVLVTFGGAAAADAARRLETERRRSERLAIEAERRRIAWELHDSAKQRVHAAHLVLSAVTVGAPDAMTPALEQVLGELRAATADMATSVEELQAPLEGRSLAEALRERAAQLHVPGGPASSSPERPLRWIRGARRTPSASPRRRLSTRFATPARTASMRS
jgi:signal transduction histidine kinase